MRKCPICDNDKNTILFGKSSKNFDDSGKNTNILVAYCEKCGMVFLLETGNLRSQYEDNSIYYKDTVSDLEKRRFDEISKNIEEVLPDKGSKILEIGCSVGGQLAALKNRGYNNLVGIDPSARCVDACKQFGFSAFQSFLPDLPELGKFDCIIANGVLEHLENPRECLIALKQHLGQDGIFYIEVPDCEYFIEECKSPFQEINSEHVNIFSKRTLKNLFASIGLKHLYLYNHSVVVSETSNYTQAVGIFSVCGREPVVSKDSSVKDIMKKYFDLSRKSLYEVLSEVQGLLVNKKEIIIWGTGQFTLKLLSNTSLFGGIKIAQFIDDTPANIGRTIDGILVEDSSKTKKNIPILVGSIIHQKEIFRKIKNLKIDNEILMIEGDKIL